MDCPALGACALDSLSALRRQTPIIPFYLFFPSPPSSSFLFLLAFIVKEVEIAIMKNSLLVAATALLGSASAEVHTMKLKKVPLSEQLVSNCNGSRRVDQTVRVQ